MTRSNETNRPAPTRRPRGKVLAAIILAAVLLAGSVAGLLLDLANRRGSGNEMSRVVLTCGDRRMTNTELAYYYWSEYFYFTNVYSDYLGDMTMDELCAAAREAGEMILAAGSDKQVRQKSSRHDLVTRYDADVQRFLQARLAALAPEAGFLGEESEQTAASAAASCRFIVDPIDGTANFVKDLRRSCVSIGYEENGRIAMEKLGVKSFGEVGDSFDPALHNAVMHLKDETLGDNVLAEVFQKGFTIDGKVIRFAMVKVAN